uniref:uncharacterized protein LOC120348313 n=1 Tax=Styela clava TaxID=7725 RepID=UPI001939563C|nr:uncharacterized protein LOC120348313 [Styela clava]
MSARKNEVDNSPWGKTSRFTFKNGTKRNGNRAILKEEKEKFFNHGTLPKFRPHRSEKWLHKKCVPVETELFQEATTILNKVRDQYSNDGSFIEAAYGERIDVNRASEVIHNYLVEHGVDGMMSVYFSDDLDCSGKMAWTGPLNKYNQPERRNFSMWVKTANDNMYFRETGILNLSNHEIGTHFFRCINDGLQPWFANRVKFGLHSFKSQALKDTEEGLASLNTAFESKVKLLWGPAMLYYTACMSLEMNFRELFDHLSIYTSDPEVRWKYIVRVKRGRGATQLGGQGRDQCYFRGAVNVLRNLDHINFNLLYAGKVTVEDLPRIQRIARLECLKTPYFLKDLNSYKRHMRNLLRINGIPKSKPLPRELALKINPPKSARSSTAKEDKLKNYNNNNSRVIIKKSPRAQMIEARQRILSSKLLSKSKRSLTDESSSDDKILELFHEDISEEPTDIDTEDKTKISYEPISDLNKSNDNVDSYTSSQVQDNCFDRIPRKQFLTARRKSDNYYSSVAIHISSSDDSNSSSSSEDLSRTERTGWIAAHRLPKLELTEFKYETKTDEMRKTRKDKQVTPLDAIVPSCASNLHMPQERIPRNITPAPTTTTLTPPTPKMFEIHTKRAKKISPRGKEDTTTPVKLILRQNRSPTPSPKVGKKTPESSRTSSAATVKSKKSLSKNISLFFEELIPFVKSRRKRVLPLPFEKNE